VIIIIKANAICRNANCNLPFVSCSVCAKNQSYRSICCSSHCYQEYIDQVQIARGLKLPIYNLPNRIDISKEKMKEIIDKPMDEVKMIARNELGEYAVLADQIGFAGAVDKANEDLRNASQVIDPLIAETIFVYTVKKHSFVKSYDSIDFLLSNSKMDVGIQFSNKGVNAVLDGKQKQHKGYVFKYERDIETGR
jgi:hypothetical protein